MAKATNAEVKTPVDVQGKEFTVGCKVARAAKLHQMDGLYVEICTVTSIKAGKVYLNDSARPLRFPERIAIVN